MNKFFGFTSGAWVCLLLTSTVLSQEDLDHEDEAELGIHGGRVLEEGDFTVELAIFEQGVEPQFRAWAFAGENELPPQSWTLDVQLTRLGGRVDSFEFAADDDFLLGDAVVTEPHSFDVRVAARYQGRVYEWTYESHEGRVTMAATMAAEMELGTRVAGMETLHQRQLLYGNLSPDPNQISHITARFPGLIESVFPQLGDNVERGDLILSVEANDSLQSYEVRAPISGTVVDIHANPGEYAGTQSLMTIANYRNVWADLSVFPSDARRIRAGQMVELQLGDTVLQSSIRYLNPGEGNSPHVIARVPVPNPDLFWTPGLLVEAFVTIDEFEVPLAVDNRALQSFRDWQVVFIKIGNDYEIRPLELGRSDGRYTEVMDGLEPGATYVVENSYLLKADLEKSGAAHPH